ncbi:MAG: DUF2752 domain-containing protein, partial [Armatimonadota bacterium]
CQCAERQAQANSMTNDTTSPPISYTVADPAAHARRLRRNESLQAFVIGAVLIGLSFFLHPDPRGFGTHQQLLMPPCFFRLLTHLPCPFCGMTTGYAQMARGHVAQAARANLMAPGAFVLTGIIALLGLWGLLTGRDWIPRFARGKHFLSVLLTIILTFWVANLVSQLVLKI